MPRINGPSGALLAPVARPVARFSEKDEKSRIPAHGRVSERKAENLRAVDCPVLMSHQAAIDLRQEDMQAAATLAAEPRLVALRAGDSPTAHLDTVTLESCPPDSMWANESLQRRMLAAADAAAISVALIAVLSHFGLRTGALVAVVSIPVVVLMFKVTGLYNREELRLGHSTLDETPTLFQLTALLALGIAIMRPTFATGGLAPAQIGTLWAAAFAAVLTGRVLARSLARRIVPAERCLVIGEVRQAERLRRALASSRTRTEIVACLPGENVAALGGEEVVHELVHELSVHRVIVVPGSTGTDEALRLMRWAKAVGVRLTVLPRILEVVGSAAVFDEVEGMALLGVPRLGLGRSSRFLKRGFDLAAASIGLLLIGPLLLALALAIKLESKGPVFFRQVRVGRGGKHFRIVKFRSMVFDAEARKEELRSLSVAGPGLFKVRDDPRVTRVGRLLRSTSLDELPQLFNVLRGDMSLVGPRPLVTDEDAQVLGLDRGRLRLQPGMTGPWQLLGSRVPLQEMVEIDNRYASQWSLWLDLKIMLRTVQYVTRRGNL
jgi:exopolysaccharide biosynthesis polyprenyl glycosylphosphotransferase